MGFSPGASGNLRGKRRKLRRTPFEHRVARFSLLLVAPGLIVSAVTVWLQPWSIESKLLLLGAEALAALLIGTALHDLIIRPLQTLANVVGALREEDYSFRARLATSNDALGELSLEVNALADVLAQQRTGAIEATALVQRVVEEVDIPIFAFDPAGSLRLVNSAGEKMLERASLHLIGRTAVELGLRTALTCPNETLLLLPFAKGTRWFVRRSSFRQQGVPHTLVVLSDVSRALREEERQAWQRLIRVIGHELNNSLAPIKSIAGTLNTRLSETNLLPEQRQDFERGLNIIEARAASLNRFLQAYRKLAQMPSPVLRECSVTELVKRVVTLETRVQTRVLPGPDLTLMADPDQLEQMLINLLRNAAEAILEAPISSANVKPTLSSPGEPSAPQIMLTWKFIDREMELTIEDNGPGLMNPSNAFVPFYTTKPQGSGIGLVLSRQICEAHSGSLELANRVGQRGCVVKVRLPRALLSPPTLVPPAQTSVVSQ
ncbi:MAG: ATP-binding protein [Acidobacteria bacterium]|nr:ATP-binding protein [Acidobacteriota bacterium]